MHLNTEILVSENAAEQIRFSEQLLRSVVIDVNANHISFLRPIPSLFAWEVMVIGQFVFIWPSGDI